MIYDTTRLPTDVELVEWAYAVDVAKDQGWKPVPVFGAVRGLESSRAVLLGWWWQGLDISEGVVS